MANAPLSVSIQFAPVGCIMHQHEFFGKMAVIALCSAAEDKRNSVFCKPFDNLRHVALETAGDINVQQPGQFIRWIAKIMGNSRRYPDECAGLECLPDFPDQELRSSFENNKHFIVRLMAMGSNAVLPRLKYPFRRGETG